MHNQLHMTDVSKENKGLFINTNHKQGRSQDFSKGGSHSVKHYRLWRYRHGIFLSKQLRRCGFISCIFVCAAYTKCKVALSWHPGFLSVRPDS